MSFAPGGCATYDDVNLILRLYEMRRETRLRDARRWFVAHFRAKTVEEFQALCPAGSETNESFRMVVSYWDMVGSFITAGVLQKELFFESNREMLLVWERLRDLIPAYREMNKDPKSFSNLESVCEDFAKWVERRGPEAYPAFVKRVRG
ncbi:MAG: hypothetical protein GC160_00225 [Acidobacteria bacterium]|nr:hypothetical protein [Acidobacteriota bacterium]